MKNDALGIETDKKKGKRKKEGVFYTPSRITRGIVEKSIGEYLNDKKLELGYEKLPELTDESIETQRGLSAKAEKHLSFWREYRSKVLSIKVIDPACGFRVIIMTQANSQVNTIVLEFLPKFKIKKMNRWCAV